MKRKLLPWPLTIGAFVLIASGVIVGLSLTRDGNVEITKPIVPSGKSAARKINSSVRQSRSESSTDPRGQDLPRASQMSVSITKRNVSSDSTTLPEQVFVAIDPSLPGHSLASRDGVISVQAYRGVSDASSPELDVTFTPPTDATAETTSPGASSQPPTMISPAGYSRSGLTYEQELFRTKWGWRAFDQAQRAASELRAEH